MFCPQCGMEIESGEISFCTRCGQKLDRIRTAMSDELAIAKGKQISRSGLNIGLGLMYIGLWPALALVLASPSAIPIAFLMLSVALLAIVFGSGALLRAFQIDEVPAAIERARRREIAFGSSLMFIGTILATLLVAAASMQFVPDAWIRIALIVSITAVFGGLLFGSRNLFAIYQNLVADDRSLELNAVKTGHLTTSSLKQDVAELQLASNDIFQHRSVTEGTTRSLESKIGGPKEL